MQGFRDLKTEGVTLGSIANFYDLGCGLIGLGDRFRARTVSVAGVKKGDRVLDVGCGTGTLTCFAKIEAGDEGYVCGIDAAPEMIEVARKKALREGIEIDFRSGVIEALPFEDPSFDVALSSLMLHHLPEDLKLRGLKEVFRVLKPGGTVLIVDFDTPTNLFGKVLSYILFFEEHVASNLKGIIPLIMEEVGFKKIKRCGSKYGIISFIEGVKP